MSRVAIALARVFSGRMFDPGKQNRRSQFAELPTPPEGSVLFLGDSITEGGAWAEWFPELPTLNRGIGGDTVRGVRSRLDTAINRPSVISLLIGTNDIGGIGDTADPARIASETRELVHAIRAAAPDAPLVVTGVLPRSASFAERIRRLNASTRSFIETGEAGPDATYLDLWPRLADGDAIDPRYSHDRLHLSGAGYREWVAELRPHLTGR